jgi:hypothetical protein
MYVNSMNLRTDVTGPPVTLSAVLYFFVYLFGRIGGQPILTLSIDTDIK